MLEDARGPVGERQRHRLPLKVLGADLDPLRALRASRARRLSALDMPRLSRHASGLPSSSEARAAPGRARHGRLKSACSSGPDQTDSRRAPGRTSTGAKICGKERQPSSPSTRWRPMLMTRGFTSVISSSPRRPVGLNTMSRTFTPTCGAARPTPSSLHGRAPRHALPASR